ncbi:dephospho-CoA kinase [Candidatus Vondammii sp. HM_W22]|uniref:dephospho-CoA kinase n=1 Tax=Candidatus Vondammii sp. HM_W22 TaxID=2687299 RepID=UPI001F145C24|nr:dephospho-CoA kinase [Candidatus Vondammii sp. HM_W22]
MLTIGLTGGIGSGKTAVTDIFLDLGVPIVDADQVAREVVEPGQPALEEIITQLGTDLLLTDSQLDRKALRKKIFENPQAREILEQILHPKIRRQMWERLENPTYPYAILSIPLLIETGQNSRVDRVLVVDCPVSLQIERIRKRDRISLNQAKAIIAIQCSREQRLSAADNIIDNAGGLEMLPSAVEELHRRYMKIALSH